MKFYLDKQILDFDQFSKNHAEEASILKPFLEQEIEFVIEEGKLKLKTNLSNPIFIDIPSKLKYHQRYFYKSSIYNEILARALGIKKGIDRPVVWDTTAGMMGDSLLIYAMGCKTIVSERNPLAAVLITNALKNSSLDIDFHYYNCLDLDIEADVIYFDPMYQEKNTKVLPKKEMQAFRNLVGADIDAIDVAKSLKLKNKRLVIKRSSKVKPIIENPDITYNGKSTSYDVYLSKI